MKAHKITPCLWFDRNAEEAVRFYTNLFEESEMGKMSRYGKEGYEQHGMPEGTVLTATFSLAGKPFLALNGGPHYKFSPAVSFFVVCERMEELEQLWNGLKDRGMVMMELDKYEWSEKYGFLTDRYGVSWQLSYGKISDTGQKISTSYMFIGDKLGRAEEAVHFYASVFPDTKIDGVLKFPEEEGELAGKVQHAQFRMLGETFMVMENALQHEFSITPAISQMIECETQDEIDHYWEKLSDGGREEQCGWLQDKFGISWQVVPAMLGKNMEDPEKAKKLTAAFMPMKKMDIKILQEAIEDDK